MVSRCLLMSIKPKYAERILSGEKRYEFRKKVCKDKDVNRVYIYATAPVKKIVGYFEFSHIHVGSPQEIWERCEQYAGIDKEAFFKYFEGCSKAYALEICGAYHLEEPCDPYGLIPEFKAPQAWEYFNAKYVQCLKKED